MALTSVTSHAHWLLRIGPASIFLYHGLSKFMDLQGTAAMMGGMPMAMLAAMMETGGGVLLIAGAFGRDLLTRLGGLLIAPVMAGAILMVHWGQWAFMPSQTHPMGGMEFQSAMMLTGLYFAIAGNSAKDAGSSA